VLAREADDCHRGITYLALDQEGDHHSAIIVLRLPVAEAGEMLLGREQSINDFTNI
jgi:hypothetical protein